MHRNLIPWFRYLLYLFALLTYGTASESQDTVRVALDRFIKSVCRNDTMFQEILIDELRLKYNSVLTLPVSDLLLSVNAEYGIAFDGTQQPDLSIGLNKLFPLHGSALEISARSSSLRGTDRLNEIECIYSVDLIRNAFGRSTRMLSHIVGIENDVARYQILQAYEIYLASLIQVWYRWMRSYEELLAAQSSVRESEKLLANIKKKKARYIAYQIDVDKAQLQVADKDERVRQAEEAFIKATVNVSYSMGVATGTPHIPDTTGACDAFTIDVDERIESTLFDSTRTGRIYALLYQRDSLSIARAAEAVLPSLSLYGGLGIGEEEGDFRGNSRVMAGVNLSFPVKRSREKAELKIAEIERDKTNLEAWDLRRNLSMRYVQLSRSIESQKKAVTLSDRRLKLAESILEAEQQDYLYGRTNLNDLIQALNTLQANRLLSVNARIELAQLRLEALELLDMLVTETDIDSLRVLESEKKE